VLLRNLISSVMHLKLVHKLSS